MKRLLRIALVAHPRHPIAEPFKGGMEAHSFHLARNLMARGHDVTVFASGDSDPSFTIDPILPVHYDRDFPWESFRNDPALYTLLDKAFLASQKRLFSGEFDVVHNNSLHRFILQGAWASGQPTITSLHVPPFAAIHSFVRNSLCANHNVTVTSSNQNRSWWGEHSPCESIVVHNGIDLSHWHQSPVGGDHAIWCGRITPNKGPHFAVRAAQKAGITLRLFGYLEDEAYFRDQIAPILDCNTTYEGTRDGAGLADEMRAAGALLFTPCWDEPFGLVAVEAMACGLPVAAFDRGAAREVIGDDAGRFAFPDDVDGLSQALRQAMRISRTVPRARAQSYFGHDRMTDRYEALYEKVIAARHAPRGPEVASLHREEVALIFRTGA